MAIAKTAHQCNAQIVAQRPSTDKNYRHNDQANYLAEKVRKQTEDTNDYQIQSNNVVQQPRRYQDEDTCYQCDQRCDGELSNHANLVLRIIYYLDGSVSTMHFRACAEQTKLHIIANHFAESAH